MPQCNIARGDERERAVTDLGKKMSWIAAIQDVDPLQRILLPGVLPRVGSEGEQRFGRCAELAGVGI